MCLLCNSVKTSEGAHKDSLWEKSSYKTRFASNLAIKMAAWITSQDAIIMHLFKQWNFKSTHVCFQITPQTVCNFSVWLFPTLLSFSNMSSDCLPERMHRHTCCIYLAFSSVRFQMSPQITCPWGCKVTLVAFVRLFSTVHFQMNPQITCPWRCKVTLVAFVWLFPAVRFQMCP